MTDRDEALRQSEYIKRLRALVSDREARLGRRLTACICTFGCQMNARDSEKLMGILREAGYEETDREDADLVLYNTCTVRENANQRVYGRLGHVKTFREKNPDMLIGICGCMMQEPDEIQKVKKDFPFVDLVFGTHNIFKLAELLTECLSSGRRVFDVWEDTDRIVEELPARRKYRFKSGVNIIFGCNNFCTYCIVPYVRGRERSRQPQDIEDEIRRLVDDGVSEVMLLGQNVNSYGKTLDDPLSFAALLRRVEKIDGLERIRFMTSHPKDLSRELIDTMAESGKICRHLHLPLQSGSSRILERMNRRYDKERYLKLAEDLKTAMPDLALTTDIIVGFPGETEEDFEETMDVVNTVRYSSAFTFIYSKRTGTRAASYPDQVPDEVIHPRFDRLLARVQQIAAEECAKDVGKSGRVLIEGVDDHEPGWVTGRLGNNLMVHFPGEASQIGSYADVELCESRGFYYIGRKR